MIPVLASLLVTFVPVEEPRRVASELSRCIDFLATEMIERDGAPAVLACVRVDGKLVATTARGWSDERGGTPVTDASRFPIGSLARVLDVAAVLQIVQAGGLRLDAPVAGCVKGELALAEPVLLRHVLEGTSGIAPWSRVFEAVGAAPTSPLERDAFLAAFRSAPFDARPGDAYAPNGAAWALLPWVLERAWDAPYATGMRERLFAPLRLASTDACAIDAPVLGLMRDCETVAASHDLEIALARSSPRALPTTCSNAIDLAAWMESLGTGRVLGPELLAAMTRPAKTNDGRSTGHGYALDLDELAGHARWWHSGGLSGFRARMAWYPSDSIAVAVVASCRGADVDALESEIARFVLGLPATRVLDLPLAPEEAARFAGGYQIGTSRVDVLPHGSRLTWRSTAGDRECAWQGRATFVDLADAEFVVRFEVAGARASGFELRRGDSTVRGTRVE